MEQPRQRVSQVESHKKYMIASRKTWWRELSVFVFTSLVWMYCVMVIYFFIDSIFDWNHHIPRLLRIIFKMNVADVRFFTFIIFLLFLVIFFLLYAWSIYNKKRYGNLNRRKYPQPASKEDMLDLHMIDEFTYEALQQAKEITYEQNPVKRGAS